MDFTSAEVRVLVEALRVFRNAEEDTWGPGVTNASVAYLLAGDILKRFEEMGFKA